MELSAKGWSEFKPATAIYGAECSGEEERGAMVGPRPMKMNLKILPYGLDIWFNRKVRQCPAKRTACMKVLR